MKAIRLIKKAVKWYLEKSANSYAYYWNFPYYKGVSSYDAEGYVNHNLWRFARTVMGET